MATSTLTLLTCHRSTQGCSISRTSSRDRPFPEILPQSPQSHLRPRGLVWRADLRGDLLLHRRRAGPSSQGRGHQGRQGHPTEGPRLGCRRAPRPCRGSRAGLTRPNRWTYRRRQEGLALVRRAALNPGPDSPATSRSTRPRPVGSGSPRQSLARRRQGSRRTWRTSRFESEGSMSRWGTAGGTGARRGECLPGSVPDGLRGPIIPEFPTGGREIWAGNSK